MSFYNQGQKKPQTYGSNQPNQPQASFPFKTELFNTLSKCAYQNQNSVAQDTSNILFNFPSQFEPRIYTQAEYGLTRSLLELKGDRNQIIKQLNVFFLVIVLVAYKGSKYPVLTQLNFPYLYPDMPCTIKIINPDPNRFRVNEYYMKGLQQDGSVFVLLREVHCWQTHKNIARVMKELLSELGSQFPFYDKSLSNYQQQQTNIPNPNYGQQQQYGSEQGNYYNQANQANWGNQGYQANQAYQANQGFPSNYGQWGSQQAQAQSNYRQTLEGVAQNVIKQIQEERKISEKLIDIYSKQQMKKNELTNINSDLKTEEGVLDAFIAQNDSVTYHYEQYFERLTNENLNNYLVESDTYSTQLIDLLSDQQAYRETFLFITEKFKKEQSDLDSIMKVICIIIILPKTTRLIAEQQFNSTLLLQKSLKQIKQMK